MPKPRFANTAAILKYINADLGRLEFVAAAGVKTSWMGRCRFVAVGPAVYTLDFDGGPGSITETHVKLLIDKFDELKAAQAGVCHLVLQSAWAKTGTGRVPSVWRKFRARK